MRCITERMSMHICTNVSNERLVANLQDKKKI